MPQLWNKSPLLVEVLPLVDPRGGMVAAVLCKFTFDILAGGELRRSAQQPPLQFVDERLPSGEVRFPSDLAAHKPAADVVVAPPGSPERAAQLRDARVRIAVGDLTLRGTPGERWPWGPLAPEHKARAALAGTYDEAWVRERMPLLPVDFDPRFHQVAPPAQRIEGWLQGDERLAVEGLYPGGPVVTALPGRCVLVSGNVQSRYFTEVATLDTLVLDAEAPRLTLVWRHAIPLRQKFEELSNVYVALARLRSVREVYGLP